MGYWGTIVVARPRSLLVDQDGVAGFGHQYRWLRELGDGWQLLELTGFGDPPDLLGPCEAVVASTGHPVFAAYVSDSYCAVVCAAVPGRVGPLTHAWDLSGPCGVFRHQPDGMAEPIGRGLDEVVAELTAWSQAAGLRADVDLVRLLLARDDDDVYTRVDDSVFALVLALGVPRIGRTLPWSLPAYDWPFSAFTSGSGPAFWARVRAMHRADGEEIPEQPWEAPARSLEAELWASLYRPGIDVVALARRAAHLAAAYRAARKSAMTTDPPVLDQGDLEMLAAIESRSVSGIVPRWSEEFDARRYADARATNPVSAGPGDQG
jgi:hypothetical protein